MRAYTTILVLVLCIFGADLWAASLTVRQANHGSQFSAELGQVLDMEVFIDAGDEELTGYSFSVSYERDVFALIPADSDGTGNPLPFETTGYLGGIPLENKVEEAGEKIILSYVEAVGGVARNAASGAGVVVRFRLEVMRRSVGETTSIRVEERGHNLVAQYVRLDAPGVEQRFADPLGEAVVRVTGFRLSPSLPDQTVIEGESHLAFDLDAFVDTVGTSVLWTHSRLSEIGTVIDPETNEVTLSPEIGLVGKRKMIFTALEVNEGLTASDTIDVLILSRPKISGLPDTVRFAEDTGNDELDLDAFVEDSDHELGDLVWTGLSGGRIHIQVARGSHVVQLTAPSDYFGSETIGFIVEDPTGLKDTSEVAVEVTPVNDPPESIQVPPIYPIQGESEVVVPLEDLFFDRDDDVSTLQAFLQIEGGVSAEIVDGQLVVSGESTGRGIVHISVQDTSGAVAESRQVVVVLEAGESIGPEISSLPEQRFLGGQVAELTLEDWVQDDSPAEELGWEALADSGLVASVQSGRLQVSGESGFSGTSTVRLSVTDPDGNRDEAILVASVLGPDDDKGPRIFAPGVIGLLPEEDREIALDDWVSDPDDPDQAIIWDIFPSAGLEADFNEDTRVLILRAGENFIEPASLGLVASDPNSSRYPAEVPVLLAAPGDPPSVVEFSAVSLDSLKAEVEIDLDEFVFDDQDEESELFWEISTEPGIEAEFDPITHELTLSRDPAVADPPSATQVLLRVKDTSGQETTALIVVGLPPLFDLVPLPVIDLFAGQVDSSLVLSDYAINADGGPAPSLIWRAEPSERIEAIIDPQSTRVLIGVTDRQFLGTEIIEFNAVDATGRERPVKLQVNVKGLGLSPQIRVFPRLELEMGQVDVSIDLDDLVVDDDSDDQLHWSASGQRLVAVEIDPDTRVVRLIAEGTEPGVDQIQFLVKDPAGNTALGILEVTVVQGGAAPEIAVLPQVLIEAGSDEEQISLAPFVVDPDTPNNELSWDVEVEPGIVARIEGDRLIVLIPAGQTGSRVLRLTVIDPQGNQTSAEMEILIQQDQIRPEFALTVGRHPIFSELMELHIVASEELREEPSVEIDGDKQEVESLDNESYRVNFSYPPTEEQERFVDIIVKGFDRGGNEGERLLTVALKWMDEAGGNIRSPDPKLGLNVTNDAAGPGQLAVLYRLGEAETPPENDGEPVYSVDLLGGRKLDKPVTLNFFPGANPDPSLGVLRWDEVGGTWEDVPTRVDPETGWLAATVDELGLFRLGRVAAESRLPVAKLSNYPNPFAAGQAQNTQIVYKVSTPGRVQLQVYNSLGQPVRLLVDEFQEVGVWTAAWDGQNTQGQRLSSGIYFYQLQEGGRRYHRSLIMVR